MADNQFFNFEEYVDATYGKVVEVVAASTDETTRHMDGLYDNTVEAIAASTDEEIKHMDGLYNDAVEAMAANAVEVNANTDKRFASLMNAVVGRRALWYVVFALALSVLAGVLMYWMLGHECYWSLGPNMTREPNKLAITLLPPAVGVFVFYAIQALPFGFVTKEE